MPDKRRFYEPILSLKHVWEKKEQNRIKGLFSLDAGWMVTFHSSGPDAGSLTIERKSTYHPDDELFTEFRDRTIDNICALLFVEKSAVMDSYTHYGTFRGDYRSSRLFAVRVRLARKPRILISDDDPQWKLLRPRIVESAAQAYWNKHKAAIALVSLATERDKVIDECERREEVEIIGARRSLDGDIVELVDQKEKKSVFLNNQGRISISTGRDDDQDQYWHIEIEYVRYRDNRQKADLMTFDPVEAVDFIKPCRASGDEIAGWSEDNYIRLLELAISSLQADLRSANDRHWQNLSGENL